MLAAGIMALVLVGVPSPGVGDKSIPIRMMDSTIYRIRSRSLIPSGLFYIIHDVSDVQCYTRCLLSTRCLSVNYRRINQMCEMSNKSIAFSDTPTTLIDNDEYHYMDRKDIPTGLIGRCDDSSGQGQTSEIPATSCSFDERPGYIMEEKHNQLLAHSSCHLNGLTEICDTNSRSWLPHTPNCAGTPPQVRSNAKYTEQITEAKVTYECVDVNGVASFSYYDGVTRTWSQPFVDCTPLPTNWEDPSPIPVAGAETFIARPYNGRESRANPNIVGDNCVAQHKCKNWTASRPVNSCPISKCSGHFNWTTATLSCSGDDCFDGNSYVGRVNCTVRGIPCQRWDAQTPHNHDFLSDRTDLGNRCVLSAETYPWCYTTDPALRWDWCPIELC